MNLVQVGLGPLGQGVVRAAVERGAGRFVAAVAHGPDQVGRDLGELCGLAKLGVIVQPDLEPALAGQKADVALLTTVSSVAKVESSITQLAARGIHIVSTCETLAFPWTTEPALAARLDAICQAHGVVCLGTGVNPGFLMDYLPVVLTSVCQRVERVRVFRVQDASIRRIPFQEKIGAGLTLKEFEARVAAGSLRHVGLKESAHLIAFRLGWRLTDFTECFEPVVATQRILSGCAPIEPGLARGVHQIGRGVIDTLEVITLDFLAAVGEPESYDRIEITGLPNVHSTIAGGVNGDIATCAIVLNVIPAVLRATPGLKTMADLPTVGFCRQF